MVLGVRSGDRAARPRGKGRGARARRHGHGRPMKVCPVFIMVLPGMCARVLMVREGTMQRVLDSAAASNASAAEVDKRLRAQCDRAYPWLVAHSMPAGGRGLLLAAMMASLMSSLASVFNSCATLFAIEIFKKRWRPSAQDEALVRVGRVTVTVVAVLSLLWLPVIPLLGDQPFIYIQKPTAYTAPPVLALFLWGVLAPGHSSALYREDAGHSTEANLKTGDDRGGGDASEGRAHANGPETRAVAMLAQATAVDYGADTRNGRLRRRRVAPAAPPRAAATPHQACGTASIGARAPLCTPPRVCPPLPLVWASAWRAS